MDNKEKKKILLLESHKIFMSVQFLLQEEKECLTAYGEGLLKGLLDPDTEHKLPVVPKTDYEKLLKKYNELEGEISRLKNRPRPKKKGLFNSVMKT